MSYAIKLTAKAKSGLEALDPAHQQFVEARLVKLGDAPSSVGRPTVSPPYPPGDMMYEFDYIVGDEFHHFAIFYRYSQDETTLYVVGIGHTFL
jgi:hypothetical protein